MYLSAYRIMWLYVMFDLPVITKNERKQATKFRNALLDLGFEMAQFSVYARFCAGKERVATLSRQVQKVLPAGGRVALLSITDKQYANIISFSNRKRGRLRKPQQLVLF